MSRITNRALSDDLDRLLNRPGSPPALALIGHAEEVWTRSIESVLAPHGYDTASAHSGAQVLARASELEPDLLLLDIDMKDLTGVQVCRRLYRERRVPPTTPVFIVSAAVPTGPERLAVLRAGAWECLSITRDCEELLRKLANLTLLRNEMQRASSCSLVDPETGVYNGLGILRRMEEMDRYARRNRRALACITLSYEAAEPHGAAAARHVGELLRSASRGSDAVGKMGRSTYVVLAPDTDPPGARRLAERYAAVLAEALEGSGEAAARDARFGCSAVADLGKAGIHFAELLKRSLTAMRAIEPSERATDRIRLFPDPTLPAD